MTSDDKDLLTQLEAATPDDLDAAPFGVVSMDRAGTVTHYNITEAKLAGLLPERVVGLHFFSNVAPCTNNYMVAGRFEENEQLDESVDYVFTLRMKPTRVRLRLLKAPESVHQYLVVERR